MNKHIPIWQDLFFWGMIISLLMKEYNYLRFYYVHAGMVLAFALISVVAERKLYILEFLKKNFLLTICLAMSMGYQVLRQGISSRMLTRTVCIYLLIYAGFLYGKRFEPCLREGMVRSAVFLGISGILGLVWWGMGICPLGFMSEMAVKYFYSAPGRMVSVFSHPILAACFMLLLIPIALFFWPQERYPVLRWSLLVIGSAGLFTTFTRSAYLVFLLIMLFWLIGQRKDIRKRLVGWYLVIALAAVAAVCVFLWKSGAVSAVYNRFFGTDWQHDRSYTLRLDAIGIVLGSISYRGIGQLFFGSGIGRGKRVLDVEWFQKKYNKKLIDNTYMSAFLDEGILITGLMFAEAGHVLGRCIAWSFGDKDMAATSDLLCLLLLPQILMIAVFDVQGWCSLLFVVCMLIGMEKACRKKVFYDGRLSVKKQHRQEEVTRQNI